ncbi:hypothetical protein EVAR_76693_1 [Eumeta japonica]|uniref:Uncharacterized protein n=1 Tax=Eumeta variegata TaxID=151549 RepID=A0A4C1STI2_EUMVA|nr:hypothetical protein EVAR_76693_1 [Eumeta japonica]
MRHKPRKKTYDVYGRNAVPERIAQNWFKFESGNFDVKEPRSGRPVTGKGDTILEKKDRDRCINYDIAKELEQSLCGQYHKTVPTHLKTARYLDSTRAH